MKIMMLVVSESVLRTISFFHNRKISCNQVL